METDSGEIPLLPSTRRYIRRNQKQDIARKELKKAQKTPDVLAFLAHKGNASSEAAKGESNPFSE